jgi:mono/diheme cytochrome c family protein
MAQTVNFDRPGPQILGNTPLSLGATASSGLVVKYSSGSKAVCTVSGTTLTLVAAGTCRITASQAGNRIYAAAAPVSRSFSVAAAPVVLTAQTITFTQPASQTMGVTPAALSAASSSGLTVALSSGSTGVCTVSGTTLTLVSSGTCTITASQAGNTTYAAATPVSRSFSVAPSAIAAVSAANGKLLYYKAAGPSNWACSSCHAAPALGISKVLRGANSASTILNAINGNVGGMGNFRNVYTSSQLNDIAAYLANPKL